MAVPHGFEIRIGYMAPKLPYPVRLHLPGIKAAQTMPSEPRLCGPELDVVIPPGDERHTLLGAFMDAWGRLEATLNMALAELLESDTRTARITASSLGIKQIIDLLNALAANKLEESSTRSLVNLNERLSRLNSKRNALVHGRWELEANVVVRRGHAVLQTQFLRQIIPTDPKIADLIANPRNQKERVKYCFTLKRIAGTTRDVEALSTAIDQFIHAGMRFSLDWIKQRPKFLSESARSRALWSTYQIVPIRATHATYSFLPLASQG